MKTFASVITGAVLAALAAAAPALQMPEVKERLNSQGFEIRTSTPEEFAAYIQSELVKWAKIVKPSGARAD